METSNLVKSIHLFSTKTENLMVVIIFLKLLYVYIRKAELFCDFMNIKYYKAMLFFLVKFLSTCFCDVIILCFFCGRPNRWVSFQFFLFRKVFNYLYSTLLPIIKLLNEQIMKAFEFVEQNSVQFFCSFISSLSPLTCPYYCCFFVVLILF